MKTLDEVAVARSRLERLLSVSVTSRLHLGMVLVGRLKVDSRLVLDLRWAHLDVERRSLLTAEGCVSLPEPVARLFYWHAAWQRLDALRTPRWPQTGMVFVNAYGAPINAEQADATVAFHCRQAGLPAVPLAGLRHPSWSGA